MPDPVRKLPEIELVFSGRDSLTHQVAAGFRRLIASGFYRVGDRLPARRELARHLNVSEFVIRAAFAELASDRLVGGKPGRGFCVLDKNRMTPDNRLVLDVSTENAGSFSSSVNRVEFVRTISQSGNRVLPVILGSSRAVPYLKPLKDALALCPDLVVIRTSACRKKVVTRLVADSGCSYATVTLGRLSPSPGRFVGNYIFDARDAVSRLADDCRAQGIGSVLQIDFGADSYIDAAPALTANGVSVERLTINASGPIDLDELVSRTCKAIGRRFDLGTLPELVLVTDDYLALGVCEAIRVRGWRVPDDLKLVVYANRGSGLFPFSRIARFELDPREDGRELGRIVVKWLRTGEFSPAPVHVAYIRGDSFPAR